MASRAVRQALAAAQPPVRKVPVRVSPKLDRFKDTIDTMLRADLDAPRKQRHTATSETSPPAGAISGRCRPGGDVGWSIQHRPGSGPEVSMYGSTTPYLPKPGQTR